MHRQMDIYILPIDIYSGMKSVKPSIFTVAGHQITGYELVQRRVARANRYSGRITFPAAWTGVPVAIILQDQEVIVRAPVATGSVSRVYVPKQYIGQTVPVVRLCEIEDIDGLWDEISQIV